jgi:heptosyltransferase-1
LTAPVLQKPPAKILVVKPSALGDIVHGLPFLTAIRGLFPAPATSIHWVVARGLHDILEGHPMIDRLWVIDKDDWKKISRIKDTMAALKGLALHLRREEFDLVVDLQGLLRSGIISLAAGAPMRIGFEEAREGSRACYTHRVRGGRDVHAIQRYLKVAAFLGCPVGTPRYVFPPAPAGSSILDSLPKDYAVIAPSAGAEAKRWPAERFGRLASKLDLKTVIVSGKSDINLAETVRAASMGNACSLAGKTSLKELIAIIERAKYLVSNDSGPMHIAAALNVPVFALIGPTNPARTGPYGKIHTVVSANLPCSPCYRRKRCGDWRCMSSITVEQVLESIVASRPG